MAEVHLRNLPPGVHFCPDDIELIRQVERKNSGINDVIPVFSISQFQPDQLPQSNCSMRGKKGELYFYDEIDPNKSRQKRSAGEFFWRNTNSSPIMDKGTDVGLKTSFELRGRKDIKTEWMMQEYSLIAAASPEGSSSLAKDKKMKKVGKFVLCKIYKKARAERAIPFNSSEDELVDGAFWRDIFEHADDKNILGRFPG